MSRYPEDALFQEITFLAYYLHWEAESILSLPHRDRRRFCDEVSALHGQLQGPAPAPHNPFEV